MLLPKNTFRQKTASQTATYGIWNNLPSPLLAELLAGAGFDWILIDAEHGPFELMSIIAQAQAIAAYDVGVIVRPATADPALIKPLLDAGLQTFLAPMVNTPEQAAALVQAMRYPPHGNRGIGAALGRASRWNRVENYLEKAHEELCLIPQVESRTAWENLDAILDVEGVHGVFFGPADLSASMGWPDQMDHPEIVAMVKEGLERTRKKGKIAGTIALTVEGAKYYEKCGANMIGVGADTLLLTKTLAGLRRSFSS